MIPAKIGIALFKSQCVLLKLATRLRSKNHAALVTRVIQRRQLSKRIRLANTSTCSFIQLHGVECNNKVSTGSRALFFFFFL